MPCEHGHDHHTLVWQRETAPIPGRDCNTATMVSQLYECSVCRISFQSNNLERAHPERHVVFSLSVGYRTMHYVSFDQRRCREHSPSHVLVPGSDIACHHAWIAGYTAATRNT